jgi:hypothetical protein
MPLPYNASAECKSLGDTAAGTEVEELGRFRGPEIDIIYSFRLMIFFFMKERKPRRNDHEAMVPYDKGTPRGSLKMQAPLPKTMGNNKPSG